MSSGVAWVCGTPSSRPILLWAAFLTPRCPASSISVGVARGWEQQVLVHSEGNVILVSLLCWSNNSSLSLNTKREKALCRGELPFTT